MSPLVCIVLSAACLGVEPLPPAGTQWTYRGRLAPLEQRPDAPPEAGKSFDLTILVNEPKHDLTQLQWVVSEHGQGAWPWFERFGEVGLSAAGAWTGKQGPAVLYEFPTGRHVTSLPSPWFAPSETLSDGATWEDDDQSYEVSGPRRMGDRELWTVQVRGPTGAIETIERDREMPLVVKRTSRVFMNQGTEYQLDMSLVASESLAPDAHRATSEAFAALLRLRHGMKRPPRSPQAELNEAEMTLLQEALPGLEASIRQGPLSRIVRDAARDAAQQTARSDSLAKLSGRFVGQPMIKAQCAGLDGAQLNHDDLEGRVTVLHFWSYRDQPLEEPYGQVGYLEFLHDQRKDAGVRVIGVAVDSRLGDEQAKRGAVTGIRKLRDFMNLSYPIVYDDGELLRQLGDPRTLGADLPLYVVVGRDGKIAHYHPGEHAVDRQRGLHQLDAVVGELLK